MEKSLRYALISVITAALLSAAMSTVYIVSQTKTLISDAVSECYSKEYLLSTQYTRILQSVYSASPEDEQHLTDEALKELTSPINGVSAELYSDENPDVAGADESTLVQSGYKDVTGTYIVLYRHIAGKVIKSSFNIDDVYETRDIQRKDMALLSVLFSLTCGIFTYAGTMASYNHERKLEIKMRSLSEGHYSERVTRRNGRFSQSDIIFNNMAETIEENIHTLELSARQREDFVASFAHELKTPLTSIIGYADTLRLKELPSEQVFKAAGFIFSEGKRLENLSLKLMDLIVLRRQFFDMKRVSMSALCEQLTGVLAPMMEKYSLTLVCNMQEDTVYAEADMLKTLIMNLVDNARKASEEGKRIFLDGAVEGEGYRISVRDEGRGIPKEELGRITEAFYMVDKSRARALNGAGLGLALCAEIAALHSSELHFASEVGVGTTVSFVLSRKAYVQRETKSAGAKTGRGRRRR